MPAMRIREPRPRVHEYSTRLDPGTGFSQVQPVAHAQINSKNSSMPLIPHKTPYTPFCFVGGLCSTS